MNNTFIILETCYNSKIRLNINQISHYYTSQSGSGWTHISMTNGEEIDVKQSVSSIDQALYESYIMIKELPSIEEREIVYESKSNESVS